MMAPTLAHSPSPALRGPSQPFVAAVAFLTLVDLFAVQAIVPDLTRAYGVSPATMGVAVNASTFGMAAAGLATALFGRGLDRRRTVALALAVLAIPTALLSVAPDPATFAALRVAQGVFMALAFTLTLAALGELLSGPAAAGAFAAYITGNVGSNLVGRFVAAESVATVGLHGTFLVFAALNLVGAALVLFSRHHAPGTPAAGPGLKAPLAAVSGHLARPELRAAFALGFCILFAFIGVFTYVNFVLTEPPFGLPMSALGVVYLVFAPSLLTTPLAGPAVSRIGVRGSVWLGLGVAIAGLAGLLLPHLGFALAGMTLVAIGTFFAQAAATGFVSRAATSDRAAASGLYLASYFFGGLVGAFVLGTIFDAYGWAATVAGVAAVLLAGGFLAMPLKLPEERIGAR